MLQRPGLRHLRKTVVGQLCCISRYHLTPLGEPPVDGLVYYPHPDTKPDHFQDETTVEVLAPFIDDLATGATVELELRSNEVAID